jgi:hypothetical protein
MGKAGLQARPIDVCATCSIAKSSPDANCPESELPSLSARARRPVSAARRAPDPPRGAASRWQYRGMQGPCRQRAGNQKPRRSTATLCPGMRCARCPRRRAAVAALRSLPILPQCGISVSRARTVPWRLVRMAMRPCALVPAVPGDRRPWMVRTPTNAASGQNRCQRTVSARHGTEQDSDRCPRTTGPQRAHSVPTACLIRARACGGETRAGAARQGHSAGVPDREGRRSASTIHGVFRPRVVAPVVDTSRKAHTERHSPCASS